MSTQPRINDVLLDAIMAVMDAAFDPHWNEAWNRRQVADALAMPNTHALLIGTDGQVDAVSEAAGFALTRHVLDEEELLLIAVQPALRGRGLGAALLRKVAQHSSERGCRRLFLEMRRGNPALALYRAHGFVQIGVRAHYYRTADGDRVDALTYEKSLTA